MKKMHGNLLLLTAAFIWGFGFITQTVAMDHIGPLTFNAVKYLIGGVTLLFVIPVLDRFKSPGEMKNNDNAVTVKGGIACGAVLAVASAFQQFGIMQTTVGKAGFITALYVVIVPLLAVVIGKKIRLLIWLCVIMSAAGLYFLSMKDSLRLSHGDLMVFLCAVSFAVHILVIDHFIPYTDGARLSCIQFFTAGLISLVPALIREHPVFTDLAAAVLPLLYSGVFSSGAGYTLQIIGQKNADPAIASMILSLESVFAAIDGFVFLHQSVSLRELFGMVLMFAAIILSQLPEKSTAAEM